MNNITTESDILHEEETRNNFHDEIEVKRKYYKSRSNMNSYENMAADVD
jgi:hypothetical protein